MRLEIKRMYSRALKNASKNCLFATFHCIFSSGSICLAFFYGLQPSLINKRFDTVYYGDFREHYMEELEQIQTIFDRESRGI